MSLGAQSARGRCLSWWEIVSQGSLCGVFSETRRQGTRAASGISELTHEEHVCP